MSKHAGSYTTGVLAGAVYLAGSFSFSAVARAESPNFAPNPNVGWYSYTQESVFLFTKPSGKSAYFLCPAAQR